MIPGFDDAITGMEVGEEKEVTIKAADAYGEPNPQLVQKVPKDKMPKDQKVERGMVLGVGLPNGQQVPATVTEVSGDEVTIDLNHPLAGKDLTFKLKLVAVE